VSALEQQLAESVEYFSGIVKPQEELVAVHAQLVRMILQPLRKRTELRCDD